MKTVIVTGASSGIGRATCEKLSTAGYRVYGLARSIDKMQTMEKELANFSPIELDLTRPEMFDTALKQVMATQVYGLVNNAGYVEPGAIEDLTMEGIRTQFETNFFGLVGLTKKMLPEMMQRNEGRIVNVSSIAGLVSLPLVGAYCASKRALEAVTDALRMELWNTGIKVVTINPGLISTNLHSVTKSKVDMLQKSRFTQTLGRYMMQAHRGLPASAVVDTIYEAIASPRPKHRYIIGSTLEKTGVRLKSIVPEGVFFSQVAKRIQG